MISRGQLRRPLFAAYPNHRKPREIRGDTQYLLGSPENARRLLAALESARAGQGMRFATAEDLRREFGIGCLGG